MQEFLSRESRRHDGLGSLGLVQEEDNEASLSWRAAKQVGLAWVGSGLALNGNGP